MSGLVSLDTFVAFLGASGDGNRGAGCSRATIAKIVKRALVASHDEPVKPKLERARMLKPDNRGAVGERATPETPSAGFLGRGTALQVQGAVAESYRTRWDSLECRRGGGEE